MRPKRNKRYPFVLYLSRNQQRRSRVLRRLYPTESSAVSKKKLVLLPKASNKSQANIPDYSEKPIEKSKPSRKTLLYEELLASHSNSLLKKYLCRPLFEKLNSLKTKFGSTLYDCIQCGLRNHNAEIGVYAADADVYKMFSELFNPIIHDLHGGFSTRSRQPEKKYGNTNCIANLDPDGEFIISHRIRCCRSFQEFPFNPMLNEYSYMEIEKRLSKNLMELTGELKGTYHKLVDIEKDEEEQLTKDNLMFQEGDQVIKDAKGCNCWPLGRGIFHNEKKNFIVWCNQEDHVKFISMQKGSNIAETYKRLIQGVTAIEKSIAFTRSERLGWVTFCPRNLGTTIRASVYIKIPRLMLDIQKLHMLAIRYHLKMRPVEEDAYKIEDGVMEIWNRRILGISEFQALVEMLTGVIEVIKAEKSLKTAMDTKIERSKGIDLDVIKTLDEGYALLNASGTTSLLKKHLTPEVFALLKNRRTCYGATLLDCIQGGLLHHDHSLGIYIPDETVFQVFNKLFNPVIEEYHDFPITKIHPFTQFGDPKDIGNLDPERRYILSVRVRFSRSIMGYPLNPILLNHQYQEIEEQVKSAIAEQKDPFKGKYYAMAAISGEVKRQLTIDGLLFDDEHDIAQRTAKICQHWPNGRGLFLNNQKNYVIWCNEKDHIKCVSLQKNGDLGETYKRAVGGLCELEKNLKFLRDDRLGFICCCPTNLGTALKASVHMTLPNLSHYTHDIISAAERYKLSVKRVHGLYDSDVGIVFQVSNKRFLGATEFDVIDELALGIRELIKLDKSLVIPPLSLKGITHETLETDIMNNLEKEFKIFSESNSKSLLKKHLTKDTFDCLKSRKTSYGHTLLDCIESGLKNLDASVGLYASDPEAYSVFCNLFESVIKEFHNEYNPNTSHVLQAAGDPKPLENPDPMGTYITKCQVSFTRSLATYPFSPCMTKLQYLEIQEKVAAALTKLTEEFEGSYSPFSEMKADERKKLLLSNSLFKFRCPFMETSRADRFWPTGRGVFRNSNKNFFVWCNEDEHMQIVSFQFGANIKEVYERGAKGLRKIEDNLKFSYDEKLGFLNFSPYNLGTAMRPSFEIRLLNLSKNKNVLYANIARNNLKIRQVYDDRTEGGYGIYEIYNNTRFGVSENSAINDLIAGVVEIIKLEKAIGQEEPSTAVEPSLDKSPPLTQCRQWLDLEIMKKLESEYEKLITSSSKSLLRQHLTKRNFERLKIRKTPYGGSLLDCIQSGLYNHDATIGIYASDCKAYTVFQELFNPIIKDCHFGFGRYSEHPLTCFGNPKAYDNLDPKGRFVLSLNISASRSIAGYPFLPIMTKCQFHEIEKQLANILETFTGDLAGKYYTLNEVTPNIRQNLIYNNFFFKEGGRFLQSANACQNWPIGRGIFQNNLQTLAIWCNEQDHIKVISKQDDGNISEAYDRLIRALNELEKSIHFTRDRIGYVTLCPTQIGTAMKASVYMTLPCLNKDKNKFQEIASRNKLHIREACDKQFGQGVCEISTIMKLGVTENECIKHLTLGVKEILASEEQLMKSTSSIHAMHNSIITNCQTKRPLTELERMRTYFIISILATTMTSLINILLLLK